MKLAILKINKKKIVGAVCAIALFAGGCVIGAQINASASNNAIAVLPVVKGGTGTNAFTSGEALVGNGSSGIETRTIADAPASGSNSLMTSGGTYTALGNCTKLLNQSGLATGVSVSANAYTKQTVNYATTYKAGTIPVVMVDNYYLENGALIATVYDSTPGYFRIGWRNMSGAALKQDQVHYSVIGCIA
jgi:hypothetical protein